MKIVELITARGHENIQGTHKTTFEITKHLQLTKRGDCIIAVGADKALAELSPSFKKALRREQAKFCVVIEAGGIKEFVKASGSRRLRLTHPTDMVVRKSSYVCDRTLAVRADKAARDLSRELVKKLKDPKQVVRITLTVEV